MRISPAPYCTVGIPCDIRMLPSPTLPRRPQPPTAAGAPVASRCPSARDRKSTRLNSSHSQISYAVFCLKKKNTSITLHILPNLKDSNWESSLFELMQYYTLSLLSTPSEPYINHIPSAVVSSEEQRRLYC